MSKLQNNAVIERCRDCNKFDNGFCIEQISKKVHLDDIDKSCPLPNCDVFENHDSKELYRYFQEITQEGFLDVDKIIIVEKSRHRKE